MYKIDRDNNKLIKIEKKNFSDAGFRERDHLQEWLVQHPNSLGEDLLVIQKEFSGFHGTDERLDILALDKLGALVVIENKLDDSGKDVTWQALKYVSYCSTLKKEEIKDIYQEYLNKESDGNSAEDNLREFFDGRDYEDLDLNVGTNSQRVILVAANFRMEVTSTVLWLLNFNINIRCFRASLYSKGEGAGEDFFLDISQIIPTREAKKYMISMADKIQEESLSSKSQINTKKLQQQFWGKCMDAINLTDCTLFANRSGAQGHWLGTPSQIKGANFNFAVFKSVCRVELYIDTPIKESNTKIFELLVNEKNSIEDSSGTKYKWENKDTVRYARIRLDMEGSIYQNEIWDDMISRMVPAMVSLENAIKPFYRKVNDAVN